MYILFKNLKVFAFDKKNMSNEIKLWNKNDNRYLKSSKQHLWTIHGALRQDNPGLLKIELKFLSATTAHLLKGYI